MVYNSNFVGAFNCSVPAETVPEDGRLLDVAHLTLEHLCSSAD
jgi:hypothetical protein